MTCPSGCEMSSYSLDTKYMTCECDVNNNGIVELDVHHISAKNIESSFLSTFKNTNYKVMRCYNLVFNFKIFCHNYGSIITLILFLIYLGFMIYYIFKEISPIKIGVSKLLFEQRQREEYNANVLKPYIFKAKNNAKSEKSKKSTKNKKNKKIKETKESFPPKKIGIARKNKITSDEKRDKTNIRLIDIVNRKSKVDKNAVSVKSAKVRKKKSIIDYQGEMNIKTEETLLNQKNKLYSINNKDKSKSKLKLKEKENVEFDNYELNNMEYYDACKYDTRTCLKTYWSVLLREHYFIFTFFSRNDYNLFYIKIERFLILICTEVTMNGLFFVHETMYKKQTGDTSFAQKIPQIIFSLLVSHALEIFLCFLSMTDKHYYEIKALPPYEKNDEKIIDILDCIKRKLVTFFVFTFLFFLFHWYFISAFCAVYQNTQVIYLRDSAISILTSFIDPFIIYGITCLIRAISLSKCCKKKVSCVYKLSDIIPFF